MKFLKKIIFGSLIIAIGVISILLMYGNFLTISTWLIKPTAGLLGVLPAANGEIVIDQGGVVVKDSQTFFDILNQDTMGYIEYFGKDNFMGMQGLTSIWTMVTIIIGCLTILAGVMYFLFGGVKFISSIGAATLKLNAFTWFVQGAFAVATALTRWGQYDFTDRYTTISYGGITFLVLAVILAILSLIFRKAIKNVGKKRGVVR